MISTHTIMTLLCLFLALNAIQGIEIDGRLRMEIQTKEQFNHNEISQLPSFISSSRDSETQVIYLHFIEKPSSQLRSQIESAGVEILPHPWIPPTLNHPTGFLTARMSARTDVLNRIAEIPQIRRINSAERIYKFQNDRAAIHTGSAEVWESPWNTTGEGVKIAVIDSGFQLDNADFNDPLIAIDYSDYPDTNFTVDNSTTGTGHGTHVAGTIVGQGTNSGGVWKGMAPGADWIALKIGAENTGAIHEEALIYAIYAAGFYHDADFINMSLSGWGEYNDGSSEIDQVVDLVWEETDCISVCAIGNEGYKRYHYSGYLAAGLESDFIAVDYADSSDMRDFIYNYNLVWYDGEDIEVQKEMTFEFFNHNYDPLNFQQIWEMTQSPRGTQSRFATATVLTNNEFYIKVHNNSDVGLTYHLYCLSSNGEFAVDDPYYTVGSPATADHAVAVGSWVTRREYMNWEGLIVGSTINVENELAPYSNRGPRVDGALKPDFCAPGSQLISVRDDDAWGGPPFGLYTIFVISNSYATDPGGYGQPCDYMALEGTSMATPAACGAIALLKSYAPELGKEELLDILYNSARDDEYTSAVPNDDWGYGKIDVEAAVESIASADDSAVAPANIKLLPNYPNPFNPTTTIEFSIPQDGHAVLKIYNIRGQHVKTLQNAMLEAGEYSMVWNGTNERNVPVSSGIYFSRLEAGDSVRVQKMVLMK